MRTLFVESSFQEGCHIVKCPYDIDDENATKLIDSEVLLSFTEQDSKIVRIIGLERRLMCKPVFVMYGLLSIKTVDIY